MPFTTLASLPARPLFPGVAGHYAHTSSLTIGEVELAAGATVPAHQHPHEQLSYVVSGRVEFTVGAETRTLHAGDCALIPGNTPHRVVALGDARVVDVFTPAREDYRTTPTS
jgi:quercetin dioxygenase-like cupin family protein